MSLFADLRGIAYAGHNREWGGWTGKVGGDLAVTGLLQLNLGLQVHFDL